MKKSNREAWANSEAARSIGRDDRVRFGDTVSCYSALNAEGEVMGEGISVMPKPRSPNGSGVATQLAASLTESLTAWLDWLSSRIEVSDSLTSRRIAGILRNRE